MVSIFYSRRMLNGELRTGVGRRSQRRNDRGRWCSQPALMSATLVFLRPAPPVLSENSIAPKICVFCLGIAAQQSRTQQVKLK